MARTHYSSPGATGFVATLVLSCTFVALAAVMWQSTDHGALAIAAQDGVAAAPVSVDATPVSPTAAVR